MPAPPTEIEAGSCPRCGTPSQPAQEYCLECGARLPEAQGVVGALSQAWWRRFGRYPGDWVWAVLLFLLIAAAGAGVAIAVTRHQGGNRPVVATGPIPSVTPPATTLVPPTASVATTTAPPPATTSPPTTSAAPTPGQLATWPAGRNGYTIVLNSIPTTQGRAAALAQARAAAGKGLPQVGVLDSSRYASLHPGYYVVFSGVYASSAQAAAALANARSAGFQLAYERQITT